MPALKPTTTHKPPPPPPPKDGGDTVAKKGDRPDNPVVGMVAHIPYPSGVEKGTLRCVHGRKGGVVWVE